LFHTVSILENEQKKQYILFMSETTQWIDEKYNEVFEEELRGLQRRCEHDPSCSIQDLQGILDGLYINEGSDWVGRGPLGNTVLAASIAAYEHFIAEKKSAQSK
jgi:hypothetical protein